MSLAMMSKNLHRHSHINILFQHPSNALSTVTLSLQTKAAFVMRCAQYISAIVPRRRKFCATVPQQNHYKNQAPSLPWSAKAALPISLAKQSQTALNLHTRKARRAQLRCMRSIWKSLAQHAGSLPLKRLPLHSSATKRIALLVSRRRKRIILFNDIYFCIHSHHHKSSSFFSLLSPSVFD